MPTQGGRPVNLAEISSQKSIALKSSELTKPLTSFSRRLWGFDSHLTLLIPRFAKMEIITANIHKSRVASLWTSLCSRT
jgi:hypothetical protein